MNRKDFVVKESSGKEIMLSFKRPQSENFEEADKIYASKISALIREGGKKRLALRSEVDKFLRESGIWSDKDEQNLKDLNQEINDALNRLRKGGMKLSEGRKLCFEVTDKRRECMDILRKRQFLDSATIESVAENERNDYIIYACTVYADSGQNYWDSFDDMKNDKLSDVFNAASTTAIEFIYNINPEFEKRLPENRWLKKYNFIDNDLNLVDRKTGERVDKEGKPLRELEEAVVQEFQNLQGEIEEETPFVDDETNEPVVLDKSTQE
jgi:hypothetical protein